MTKPLIWIMVGFAFLLVACDGRSIAMNPDQPLAPLPAATPARVVLSPAELVLNVPSEDPCPCPYESTGSFDVEGGDGKPLAWQVADASIAKVGADGMFSALATGSTLVTLVVASQSATASVRVLDRGGRAAVVVR